MLGGIGIQSYNHIFPPLDMYKTLEKTST